MKKVYLLITAICLTALTGCIKEEPFTLEEATIEVNLDTRSGAVSEQQGDRIEDVMIWVFKDEANNWNTLAGWRTYTPPTTAYAHTSLTLHIPVALCNGNKETYRLVAVLNQSTWGDIVDADGNPLTLNSETTYAQLIGARFANQALIEQAIEENTPGTPSTPDNPGTSGDPGNPEAMPVSHWCDVVVTKDNTHANGQCATANLDVFRSIAKTQLFVTKKSNDFNLVIKSATLKSSNAPTEGMVLSSVAAADLKEIDAAPAWFGTNAPTQFNTSFSQSLKKADGTAAAVTVEANAATYTDVFVGSAFLYENKGGNDGEWNKASKNGGYYMAVTYDLTPDKDNDDITENVWLPPVARNHDYQVKATVDAGGKMTLKLNVIEWTTTDEQRVDFEDEVSLAGNGIIWNDATISDNSITFGPNPDLTQSCTFTINTPVGGKWYAELTDGDVDAFAFVSTGTTLASGEIKPNTPVTLTIKTLTNNYLKGLKQVKFRMFATTADGRNLTVHLANGVDEYTIIQNQN